MLLNNCYVIGPPTIATLTLRKSETPLPLNVKFLRIGYIGEIAALIIVRRAIPIDVAVAPPQNNCCTLPVKGLIANRNQAFSFAASGSS
jgi:hypothetical protein